MSDLTPDQIAGREFRSAFRGYDPAEVRAFLADVAGRLDELERDRSRLGAQMGELAKRDLKTEFESVGREVASVLEAAREAAEAMRTRAGADAQRWRAEAVAEAESDRRRASADAEQLRSDAWTTSEELLRQAQAEAGRIRAEAEKEALRLVGDSEREAHRLVAAGRRETEEASRAARMESERLLLDAQTRHDQIIEAANKQAETAQERTRALENRRNELARELESVRSALLSAESELDSRRGKLGLSEPSDPVPAVAEEPEAEGSGPPKPSSVLPGGPPGWELGETVRVVRPDGPITDVPRAPKPELQPSPEIKVISAAELAKRKPRQGAEEPGDTAEEPEDADAVDLSGEPEEPVASELVEEEAEPESAEPESAETESAETESAEPEPAEPEDVERVESEPELPAEQEAESEPAVAEDLVAEAGGEPAPMSGEPGVVTQASLFEDVADLFARLREPVTTPTAGGRAPSEARPEPSAPPSAPRPRPGQPDPFEMRDRLLLPITNRSLRNLKRQLTEEANLALEEVRAGESGWTAAADAIRGRIRADLVVLAAESFGAGHAAAEELVGDRIPRPATPKGDVAEEFAADLTAELNHALADGRAGGQGPAQLGASVSRVFRAWRTDEAERRVRAISLQAYNRGLASSLGLAEVAIAWVVAGRGCATCRAAAAADELPDPPPLHGGCDCALTMA